MSDPSRKDFSQQLSEKTTPDEQKTTGEKIKEKITGVTDRVKAVLTPDSRKSIPQQVGDKARGGADRVDNGEH